MPTEARIGHVMYSNEGDAWIKAGDNEWKSLADGYELTTWSDSLMKSKMEITLTHNPDDADVEKLKGIYETKRTLASELIPYTTAAVRTFQCRLDILCSAIKESQVQAEEGADPTAPRDITIHIAGCEEKETKTIPACHPSPTTGGSSPQKSFDGHVYCSDIANNTFTREADLLKMITEYDASYRSTLQFAGDLDLWIDQMRWPLTNTIRKAASMIGQMNRIPCFLSSCDDYPPDFSSSSSAP
jgi:hypothetical protein